jgi:pimeloyl-ACP methyl ester carboxylesterase
MANATFVLVHGAWHGGWCWDPIVPALETAGHRVEAIDLPFTGPDDDVAFVTGVLDRIEGRKVVAGHSYGGQIISEAASGRTDVDHLVYVCAFALEQDEELFGLMAQAPATVLSGAIEPKDDELVLDHDKAVEAFYALSPPDLAAKAKARLRRFQILPPLSERRVPAWKATASTYVVCTEDQALHPDVQRLMAKRCTHTVELAADHSPFLSTPDELARALLDVT